MRSADPPFFERIFFCGQEDVFIAAMNSEKKRGAVSGFMWYHSLGKYQIQSEKKSSPE